MTINKQVLSLVSIITFHNLQQLIAKPEEKPLTIKTIIVGGLKYTKNIENLRRRYLLEEKY
jgi:hypothetical protein